MKELLEKVTEVRWSNKINKPVYVLEDGRLMVMRQYPTGGTYFEELK